MERLTERFSNGQAAVYGCGNNCKYDFKYCNNHLEDCPTINEIYEKLAEYEDLEEQGKLLKLPCAVGDMVYHFCKEFGQILEYDVDFINISDGITTISCSSYSQGIDDTGECLDEFETDITDFDFNTSTPYGFVSVKREEVEQKLKEMEDRKNGKVD